MLRIWGRTNSINVKKVLWTLEELGLPYERLEAGMQYGVVNTPAYRKLNPNGLVPTLEEDGFVLWESHSIVRYLAAKHSAGKLWPTDLRQRADAERWMDWKFTLFAQVRTVFWGLVRTPPEKRDAAAIEAARVKAAELFGFLDAALAGRRFVAGDQLTIGDIPIGCCVQLWMRLPVERPAAPSLQAWFNRLCERPAYRKTVDLPLS